MARSWTVILPALTVALAVAGEPARAEEPAARARDRTELRRGAMVSDAGNNKVVFDLADRPGHVLLILRGDHAGEADPAGDELQPLGELRRLGIRTHPMVAAGEVELDDDLAATINRRLRRPTARAGDRRLAFVSPTYDLNLSKPEGGELAAHLRPGSLADLAGLLGGIRDRHVMIGDLQIAIRRGRFAITDPGEVNQLAREVDLPAAHDLAEVALHHARAGWPRPGARTIRVLREARAQLARKIERSMLQFRAPLEEDLGMLDEALRAFDDDAAARGRPAHGPGATL